MYRILWTIRARNHLRDLRKFDQQRIVSETKASLLHEPANESQNRKRLRPNDLAEWELRVGGFRVFYDVSSSEGEVAIVAVGVKGGNELFIAGERFEL